MMGTGISLAICGTGRELTRVPRKPAHLAQAAENGHMRALSAAHLLQGVYTFFTLSKMRSGHLLSFKTLL
jgi:hypothetical protein